MDVSCRTLASAIAVLLIGMLSLGCAERSQDAKLASLAARCEPSVAKGRYIIHRYDGSIQLVTASTVEELIERHIDPDRDNIRIVTHDQIITQLSGPTQVASASADNWGPSAIRAPELWRKGYFGQGITVAVIDSGVDISHPSLASNVFMNAGEIGLDGNGNDKANNGLDDDGNGFVDDVVGYNFASDNARTVDETGHGTHVAGIIAARHSDSEIKTGYVQGVAPHTKIMSLDFMANGYGYIADALTAIKYAASMGARVINASWGGTVCMPEMARIAADLESQGVLFVVAAGNEGLNLDAKPSYPAALAAPSQITVGSLGWNGYRAEHSNFGDVYVNIFAPGVGIVSTIPGGGTAAMTGTSMATPLVAGAAAAIWSARPQASVDEIRTRVLNSVFRSSVYRNSTQGRLDLSVATQTLP